eukprot:2856255-Pyramimonas_sp.AAC.1
MVMIERCLICGGNGCASQQRVSAYSIGCTRLWSFGRQGCSCLRLVAPQVALSAGAASPASFSVRHGLRRRRMRPPLFLVVAKSVCFDLRGLFGSQRAQGS